MATSQSLPQMLQLAAKINESVTKLQKVLSDKGVESPSFDEDAQFHLPVEATAAQDCILDATAELHDLLLDPMVLVKERGGVRRPSSMPTRPDFVQTH